MKTKDQYASFAKPVWAPPSWVFGPVWTFLYIVIAASFCYEAYLYANGRLPLLPFVALILNVLFNAAYTPLQFTVRNFFLATIDILLVLATLVWCMVAVYPYAPIVSYANIPYLAWVCFATVLQLTVTRLNRKR